MTKKITALLLALVMVFALCACGNKDDSAKDNNDAEDTLKVGFIFLHDENSTYDLNFMNAAKEACANLGLSEEQ